MSKHFEHKNPLAHIVEKRVEGMISITEAHGTEMPGHLSAAADSSRETALILLLFWLFLMLLSIPFSKAMPAFCAFGLGWIAWKGGRSGWLGWSKLERMHRVIEQEKYEIEHHRPQEREELIALYKAKGFEGKLLTDVVDVLMADQDRLLKVMLEEEMGLTLQAYEHPLQQVIGALLGAFISFIVAAVLFFFSPSYGMWFATFFTLSFASILSASYEKNRLIPAVIWNLSIGTLALGIAYFLFRIFL